MISPACLRSSGLTSRPWRCSFITYDAQRVSSGVGAVSAVAAVSTVSAGCAMGSSWGGGVGAGAENDVAGVSASQRA
jgi:hypothetical protein